LAVAILPAALILAALLPLTITLLALLAIFVHAAALLLLLLALPLFVLISVPIRHAGLLFTVARRHRGAPEEPSAPGRGSAS
jgi:hypothetical protein